jgi:hypothetical protein
MVDTYPMKEITLVLQELVGHLRVLMVHGTLAPRSDIMSGGVGEQSSRHHVLLEATYAACVSMCMMRRLSYSGDRLNL